MSDNKRIAKNTIFLYIRMLIILIVMLYTSRVILDKLGVEDFGLYNVVGGVVAMLSFISGTLSFGTSRFITYDLGTGNHDKLKTTFCTSLYANLIIGIILFIVLETIGVWFVYNKLVIPDNRLSAALIVYQISLVTMFFNFIQIPYRSGIIAHERMGVYAYVSIFEAFGRLGVCYLLAIGPFDKLVNYALFLAIVQILTTIIYGAYCMHNFAESRLSLRFDTATLKNIIGFSGWNIAANMGETFKMQGIVIILNMFFQPAVVGAQALANQIGGGIMQFVNSFRTAIDPQVIKLYAAGQYDASRRLTLSSTVYTFDLILLLALPCIFMMNTILRIWLVEVPEYAVVFAQWTIMKRIPSAVDGSFFTPMVASGKIKRNSLFALASCLLMILLLWMLFSVGGSVMWVQYLGLIFSIGFSFLVKPYILYKDVNYKIGEMVLCFWNCFKVLVPSVVLSSLFYYTVGEETIWTAALSLVLIILTIVLCSVVFMDSQDRHKLFHFLKMKIR